jgi:nitroimidazol reductase NimA-like FMN-containing flavoprotein (pyridoxamine 5'-phosphate oxidase superfamily)
MNSTDAATDRVRLRRMSGRGAYDRDTVFAVLDAGVVAHVGVITDDGPLVMPMAYGHNHDSLFLHGAAANATLRAAVDRDVCVTVTVVDAMVIGRSPFHNSMNYRSAVVRGTGRQIVDAAEKVAALRIVSDHVMPTWSSGRAPTPVEVRQTLVIAVPLVEMSAKIRTGDPLDETSDLAGPHWAGHVPLNSAWGRPVPAADLSGGIDVPEAIAAYAGRRAEFGR